MPRIARQVQIKQAVEAEFDKRLAAAGLDHLVGVIDLGSFRVIDNKIAVATRNQAQRQQIEVGSVTAQDAAKVTFDLFRSLYAWSSNPETPEAYGSVTAIQAEIERRVDTIEAVFAKTNGRYPDGSPLPASFGHRSVGYAIGRLRELVAAPEAVDGELQVVQRSSTGSESHSILQLVGLTRWLVQDVPPQDTDSVRDRVIDEFENAVVEIASRFPELDQLLRITNALRTEFEVPNIGVVLGAFLGASHERAKGPIEDQVGSTAFYADLGYSTFVLGKPFALDKGI